MRFVTCTVSDIIRMIISKRMRWAENVALLEEVRNAHNILIQNSEQKRQLGKYRRGRENNIRMDIERTGWDVVVLIHLAQNRVHWSCEHDNELRVL
jgi:hypothetical protein